MTIEPEEQCSITLCSLIPVQRQRRDTLLSYLLMPCVLSHRLAAYPVAVVFTCGSWSDAWALLTLPSTRPQVKGPSDRKSFKAKQFAAQHDLGDPIRVEWFLSSAEK